MSSVSVAKRTPFHVCIQNYLGHNASLGGILSDSATAWLSHDAHFTCVSLGTGARVSSWAFGRATRDSSTKVICVTELPLAGRTRPLLVVALDSALNGGMLCVYDMCGSRLLRAVVVQGRTIVSVGLVNGGGGVPGPLSSFDGVLAVGCIGGEVLLVDLCKQAIDEALNIYCKNIRNEINPCQLTILNKKDLPKLDQLKESAENSGNHLAIHLNYYTKANPAHFTLKGPNNENRVNVDKSEVIVSALYYCPQLCSLVVGYDFGAFQIWNLLDMTIFYTSAVHADRIPITHFVLQEPTDDPRACCYLWAIYGYDNPKEEGFPIAVMYSLNFESRDWHEGYGYLYQNFQSSTIRFQVDLNTLDNQSNAIGGQCVSLRSYVKGPINRLNSFNESGKHEDSLVVCLMVWNIWCNDNTYKTYLSIFDLNQWYMGQMPSQPKPGICHTYTSQICLSDYTENNGPILDALIHESKIWQFYGTQRLEEHYYPNSLSYAVSTLSHSHSHKLTTRGVQASLLHHLDTTGPVSLLHSSSSLYSQCLRYGLLPLYCDNAATTATNHITSNSNSNSNSMVTRLSQYQFLLSVALDHGMYGFLANCATSWCDGSAIAVGGTLGVVVEWAWQRGLVLKGGVDTICIPLFDFSGTTLDTNTRTTLNHCIRQLSYLRMVFSHICNKLPQYLSNPELISKQLECISTITLRLEILQWMLNIGLLPETPQNETGATTSTSNNLVPYPVDKFTTKFSERRESLKRLNLELFQSDGSLLFIDNLIELHCGGEKLKEHWASDGGNGLYPPQSLQTLLRTYLVENVKELHKHMIVTYLFLDLVMALDQTRFNTAITYLIKFPTVFHLSQSVVKVIQAFWQLDHGDFGTAMEQLLDPGVSPVDLEIWQHRLILKVLFAHKQHSFALLYLQVRNPPLSELEDIFMNISLYVHNKMINEALQYQRTNKSQNNEDKLLNHMYKECLTTGQLNKLIGYTLSDVEEQVLFDFMRRVDYKDAETFQTIYCVQRGRFVDLLSRDEEFGGRKTGVFRGTGLLGQSRIGIKETVVNALSKYMPDVSRSILKTCQTDECRNMWNETRKVKRSIPMSVVIHDCTDTIKSRSTIINAGLLKAHETWDDILAKSTKTSNKRRRSEQIPFLCTLKANPDEETNVSAVVFPKILNNSQITRTVDVEEEYSSPVKRMKLSPRKSLGNLGTPKTPVNKSSSFRMDTPIVKRLSIKPGGLFSETPQGILKVKHFLSTMKEAEDSDRGNTTTPENLEECDQLEKVVDCTLENKTQQSRLSPRKSLRTLVHFDDTAAPNLTSSLTTTSTANSSPVVKGRVSKDSTQSTSQVEDDSFYSVLSDQTTAAEKDAAISSAVSSVEGNSEDGSRDTTENDKELDKDKEREKDLEGRIARTQSPQRRRSIKDISLQPTRSSPRLRKSLEREFAPSPLLKTPTRRKSVSKSSLDSRNSSQSPEKGSVISEVIMERRTSFVKSVDGVTEITEEKREFVTRTEYKGDESQNLLRVEKSCDNKMRKSVEMPEEEVKEVVEMKNNPEIRVTEASESEKSESVDIYGDLDGENVDENDDLVIDCNEDDEISGIINIAGETNVNPGLNLDNTVLNYDNYDLEVESLESREKSKLQTVESENSNLQSENSNLQSENSNLPTNENLPSEKLTLSSENSNLQSTDSEVVTTNSNDSKSSSEQSNSSLNVSGGEHSVNIEENPADFQLCVSPDLEEAMEVDEYQENNTENPLNDAIIEINSSSSESDISSRNSDRNSDRTTGSFRYTSSSSNSSYYYSQTWENNPMEKVICQSDLDSIDASETNEKESLDEGNSEKESLDGENSEKRSLDEEESRDSCQTGTNKEELITHSNTTSFTSENILNKGHLEDNSTDNNTSADSSINLDTKIGYCNNTANFKSEEIEEENSQIDSTNKLKLDETMELPENDSKLVAVKTSTEMEEDLLQSTTALNRNENLSVSGEFEEFSGGNTAENNQRIEEIEKSIENEFGREVKLDLDENVDSNVEEVVENIDSKVEEVVENIDSQVEEVIKDNIDEIDEIEDQEKVKNDDKVKKSKNIVGTTKITDDESTKMSPKEQSTSKVNIDDEISKVTTYIDDNSKVSEETAEVIKKSEVKSNKNESDETKAKFGALDDTLSFQDDDDKSSEKSSKLSIDSDSGRKGSSNSGRKSVDSMGSVILRRRSSSLKPARHTRNTRSNSVDDAIISSPVTTSNSPMTRSMRRRSDSVDMATVTPNTSLSPVVVLTKIKTIGGRHSEQLMAISEERDSQRQEGGKKEKEIVKKQQESVKKEKETVKELQESVKKQRKQEELEIVNRKLEEIDEEQRETMREIEKDGKTIGSKKEKLIVGNSKGNKQLEISGSKVSRKRAASSSGKLEKEENKATTGKKRNTRSKSVDDVDSLSDTSLVKTSRPVKVVTRRKSMLTPIVEEEKDKTTKTDDLTSYTAARRLTRRQRSLLENNLTPRRKTTDSDNTDEDDDTSETTADPLPPVLPALDPIQLLDRGSFEGEVDPEEEVEQQATATSPPSSVGSSVKSAVVVVRGGGTGTGLKRGRKTSGSELKREERAVSEVSDVSASGVRRSTRNRKGSTSSNQSDVPSVSVKTPSLAKIDEEIDTEVRRKRGRPRKLIA